MSCELKPPGSSLAMIAEVKRRYGESDIATTHKTLDCGPCWPRVATSNIAREPQKPTVTPLSATARVPCSSRCE